MKKFKILVKLAFGEETRMEIEAESILEALTIARQAYPDNFGLEDRTTPRPLDFGLEVPASAGLLY